MWKISELLLLILLLQSKPRAACPAMLGSFPHNFQPWIVPWQWENSSETYMQLRQPLKTVNILLLLFVIVNLSNMTLIPPVVSQQSLILLWRWSDLIMSSRKTMFPHIGDSPLQLLLHGIILRNITIRTMITMTITRGTAIITGQSKDDPSSVKTKQQSTHSKLI